MNLMTLKYKCISEIYKNGRKKIWREEKSQPKSLKTQWMMMASHD